MTRPPTACQGVVPPVTEPSHAVFLSYASQDAEAAQRICEALRAAELEVWFDQSALRGGDVWDQAIRKQIKTCVLFIPVISRHTHDRDEGYFRLEWKLAVDRSHLMTSNKAFLLPVVIDDTREDDENVPDRFKDIHWTRLPAGETPAAFVERVRRLVAPEPSRPTTVPLAAPAASVAPPATERLTARPPSKRLLLQALAALAVIGALGYIAIDKFWVRTQPPPTPPAVPASAGPAAFSPSPHSIAVLPFVNMSGDKEQEYFSDGLTEEILNSLARINEFQVSARTSSFSFRGKDTDIRTIAHKLNVASILEGSVRRSGRTIRVTAQLNNALTGFHLWSQTYDRDLSDVLKLQTDIANAVASALKVTLLGDVAAKIEVGGTRNPAALDAYLHGMKAYSLAHNGNGYQAAIAAYTEAIRLDPNYALAFAARAAAIESFLIATGAPDYRERLKTMEVDARQALALAPDLAEGHQALARFLQWSLDFARANEEYERALALAPGNALVLREYSWFAVFMGQTEAGLAAARRAVVLDPLNRENYIDLGRTLFFGRQYDEAISALKEDLALAPDDSEAYGLLGLSYYALGNLESARASCETRANKTEYEGLIRPCLAAVYAKLGRRSDAESVFAKYRAAQGDAAAYQYAEIYAQWGNIAQALNWLETARRLQDAGLVGLKTDPLVDPLRKEPRFQAIERELKFPE
jgi:TolB-like protein